MVTDPVCKMTIDENEAAGKSEYNGKTYYFCAPGCQGEVRREPVGIREEELTGWQ
jgi:YHS domain-containing protein